MCEPPAFVRSGSTQFAKLPSEVGFVRSLDTLCLISNSLTELPPELGLLTGLTHLYLNGNFLTALPDSGGALPQLQELCLDANKIERLPQMTSPKLVLLTAPGNKIKEVPLLPHMQRLEVHGNQIHTITTSLGSPVFHNLVTLKAFQESAEKTWSRGPHRRDVTGLFPTGNGKPAGGFARRGLANLRPTGLCCFVGKWLVARVPALLVFSTCWD